MPIYKINNEYLIFKGAKIAEQKFRKELSLQLIEKFGKGYHEQIVVKEMIVFSLNYYITKFKTICLTESSYTFYKNVFWFHEQATEVVHLQLFDNLPAEISEGYIASYRRVLKFIIEIGCEIKMVSGEKMNEKYKDRAESLLNDLLFLGEMIMMCVDLYAEQSMIEDVADISFDENDMYTFSRRHHYNFVFKYFSKEVSSQITKKVIDLNGYEDFIIVLKNCFGINLQNIEELIGWIHKKLKLKPGKVVSVNWDTFTKNLNISCGIPIEIANQFFDGLKIDSLNKMPFEELVRKPYNLNRFIYRPFIIWNIDTKDFAIFGVNCWVESIRQLTTNAFQWGKAPHEWMKNPCFKSFINKKMDEHDKMLDNAVEDKLKIQNVLYDRSLKSLKFKGGSTGIDLGEIDFIIIAEKKNIHN